MLNDGAAVLNDVAGLYVVVFGGVIAGGFFAAASAAALARAALSAAFEACSAEVP